MEDITTQNVTNPPTEATVQATCWSCTSQENKANGISKYQRDEKGKLVKRKSKKKQRKTQLKKVRNPNYFSGVARFVKVEHKLVVDGKCRITGECETCHKQVSCYVAQETQIKEIGDTIQATCWSCTSAVNKERGQSKYVKDADNHLVRVSVKLSKRPHYEKVINPKYTRSVLRKVKVRHTFHEKNKVRIEGECLTCHGDVSAFVKNTSLNL